MSSNEPDSASFRSASTQNGVSTSNGGDGSDSIIQVVVRLRPMNSLELQHGTVPVVTASTEDRSVTVIKGQGTRQVRSHFSFDQVFTAFSTQEEVFDATLRPVIDDIMMGFESTVFAYGQTGTGKTYTMEGDLEDEEMFGVIPRCARAIFERLDGDGDGEYTSGEVTCSYLEIYNEELSDLLLDETQSQAATSSSPHSKRVAKLEIMDGKAGTCCRGLSERTVTSAEDVLSLMRDAQRQRKIGETKMNKSSSRSHCLFTIKVCAKKTLSDGNILEFDGKLHLVDLAGSESAKTASLTSNTDGGKDLAVAEAEATRGRERMNINRSLLTLGRVIKMLKEKQENPKKNVFIPFRESKLTRILQEALGGRSKTVIVATLSPSVTAVEESISTLNYAQWANGITNKPVSTTFLSTNTAFVSPSKSAAGGDSGCGITVEDWNDMECRLAYMQAQVEEAQGALARKHMAQQVIIDRAERAEEGLATTAAARERENEESRIKIQGLESETADLQSSLAAETAAKERLDTELAVTKDKLQMQTSRAEKAEADFAESEETRARENAEAASNIATLESSLASEVAAKERLAAELVATKDELERQIARAEKAESDFAESEETRARENAEAAASIASLESSLAAMTTEKERLEAELAATEEELQKQITRAEKAEADFAESEETRARENAEAAATIASLETSLAAMTTEKERLEAELASTKAELQRQIARAESAEAEVARLEQELDKANATIAELRKELADEIEQKLTVAGKLRSTEIELRKTAAVLDATRTTEQELTKEATALLIALKQSISESESLHGLIVQTRTKESERRAATRSFNQSAVAVLRDVSTFIDNLSGKTEEYRDLTIVNSKDGHSADHAALEASLALVGEIGEKVRELTSAMKDKIYAPKEGLLVRLSQTSAQVSDGLSEATNTLGDGEKVLAGSCQSAREQLAEHSKKVKGLECRFVEDSDRMLKALEENLANSKGRLADLTISVTEAIDAALKERTEVREALNGVLSRWNESSLHYSTSLSERGAVAAGAVSASMEDFSQSMSNHDEVSKHLSAQKTFVVEKGDGHLGDVSSQMSLLEEQKDNLATTHQRQKQLCDDIIKNVMEGVRQLVTGQMAAFAKDQEECFASLEQQNDGLVGMNEKMGETANHIFTTVGETNEALVKKGEEMKLRDEEASLAMSEANEAFVTLKGIADEHVASTAIFSENAGGKVRKLGEVDSAASAKMVADLRQGRDSCSEKLTEDFGKAGDDLSIVTASGREISTYSETDLIPSASQALEEIASPRSEVASSLTSTFNRISTEVGNGEAAVRNTAESQCMLMADLRTVVDSKEEEWGDVAKGRRTDIDSRHDGTLNAVTTYGNEATGQLECSKSHTEKVRVSIQEFATDVIQADEEVEAPPVKLELPYSEDFSATPSQDVIWKTLSFATINSELFDTIGKGDIAQHLPPIAV